MSKQVRITDGALGQVGEGVLRWGFVHPPARCARVPLRIAKGGQSAWFAFHWVPASAGMTWGVCGNDEGGCGNDGGYRE